MKLSLKTDYALRIVLYVYKVNTLTLGINIVNNCFIPKSLGLKVITKLVKGNILKSFPGKNGGITYSKSSKEVNLYDVISIIEELYFKDCIKNPDSCEWRNGNCSICNEIKKIQESCVLNFKRITFDYLLNQDKKYLTTRAAF